MLEVFERLGTRPAYKDHIQRRQMRGSELVDGMTEDICSPLVFRQGPKRYPLIHSGGSPARLTYADQNFARTVQAEELFVFLLMRVDRRVCVGWKVLEQEELSSGRAGVSSPVAGVGTRRATMRRREPGRSRGERDRARRAAEGYPG